MEPARSYPSSRITTQRLLNVSTIDSSQSRIQSNVSDRQYSRSLKNSSKQSIIKSAENNVKNSGKLSKQSNSGITLYGMHDDQVCFFLFHMCTIS